MDKICDYCDAPYDDSLDTCPHCGAANDFVRRGVGTPQTIEELKQWYESKNLPPENVTRFFIGSDCREAQAFGIYKDEDGDFVVYKNKSDGSRAVRYKGGDESYAVNELYLKLKEHIAGQKNRRQTGPVVRQGGGNGSSKKTKLLLFALIAIPLLLIFFFTFTNKKSGYYDYGGDQYYYSGSGWYQFTDDWSPVADPGFGNDYGDYYVGDYNTPDGGDSYGNWDNDPWAYNNGRDDNDDWDDAWDDDYDWDDDFDWDSDFGDWDSDW